MEIEGRRDEISVPVLSEMTAVRADGGGWQRLEDYCANGPKGNRLVYTATAITMDEEVLVSELGERVVNEILGLEVEGWGALMDALYAEDVRLGRV